MNNEVETMPFPRPRTLEQEIIVESRRCKPCYCCGHTMEIREKTVKVAQDFTAFQAEGWKIYRVWCPICATRSIYGYDTPKQARLTWNITQAQPGKGKTKAEHVIEGLRIRLRKANERFDRCYADMREYRNIASKAILGRVFL